MTAHRDNSLRARAATLLDRLPTRTLAAGSGLALGNGMLQAGMFLATVFVARALGQSELGVYAVSTATGLAVVGGLGSGVPVLALREASAGRADLRFCRRIEAAQVLLTTAAAIAAAGIAAVVLGGSRGLFLGALAGGASVVLSQLSLISALHTGLGRFRAVVLAQSACGVLVVLLTGLALALGGGTFTAVVALGVAGIPPYLVLRRQLAVHFPVDAGIDTSRLLSRSRAFIGTGLIYGSYQRVDALILLAVTSPATAGIYAVAYRMLGILTLLGRGVGVVLFTRLSALFGTGEWEPFRRRCVRLFWLSVLPPAALVFVLMPWLVDVVYGPSYSDVVAPARVLLFSLVPFSLYFPNAHALNASSREGSLMRVLLVSTALDALLVATLGPPWGASGAAAAWLLTEFVVLVIISRRMACRTTAPARETVDAASSDHLSQRKGPT